MTHVTCRLTVKNRDQLRNPTLGNRVGLWATFFTYAPPSQSPMSGKFGTRKKNKSANKREATFVFQALENGYGAGGKRERNNFGRGIGTKFDCATSEARAQTRE